MDILSEHYPDDEHWFIYDNATTHLKQANNALFPGRCQSSLLSMAMSGMGRTGEMGRKKTIWGV